MDNTPVKTVPDERDESVPAPDSDYVSSMISQEDLDDTTTVFRIRIPPATQSNYLKQEELSPGHGSSTSTSSSTSLDNDNDAPETPPAFETSESGYVTDSAESPDGLNATPEFNVEPKVSSFFFKYLIFIKIQHYYFVNSSIYSFLWDSPPRRRTHWGAWQSLLSS